MGAQKAPEALSTAGINPLVDSRRATLEEVIRACYISYPHRVRNLPTYFDAEASWDSNYLQFYGFYLLFKA